MSKRNTLEAKKLRRYQRAIRKAGAPESVAEYDFCTVTGKWRPTDFDHGISDEGWRGIQAHLDIEQVRGILDAKKAKKIAKELADVESN